MNLSTAHFSAIIAFLLWGLFPIYWKFFSEVPAWDLFGHRLLWSFLTLGLLLSVRGKLGLVLNVFKNKRQALLLTLSAGLISSNWLLYIYAVNTGQILEASMGYFLNPLFNVFMGWLILKERLRPTQWPSIILALLAIILIGIQADIDHIPWIAIILSVTFALYGLIRKVVQVGSVEGLAVETTLVIVPVLIAWYFQSTTPLSAFSYLSAWQILALSLAGVVTGLPLVLFAFSAKRLRLTTLGFIQYLSPTLKFLCGLLIFHEPLSHERLQAFVLIWIALVWYTAESYLTMKRLKKG